MHMVSDDRHNFSMTSSDHEAESESYTTQTFDKSDETDQSVFAEGER